MTWPDVHYKKLTVPAWEVCELCDGLGPAKPEGCGMCRSDGGKWNEALECRSSHPEAQAHLIGAPYTDDCWATRSTILFQLYDPCGECGGKGWTGPRAGYCGDICPFCLKDSDGNPTGAAEGTGQGWKIEEVE